MIRLASTAVFVLSVMAMPSRADELLAHDIALARFITAQAGGVEAKPNDVLVALDASLPKLGKTGRLRAILHRRPHRKLDVEVLSVEGDSTVKHEVLARYLNAQVQADQIPAETIAVTPLNYRFRYVGSVGTSETLAYVFEIEPKKKRPGLIAGHLWIDGRTGLAVRQDGRLVKSPSVYIRSVEILREFENRGGLQCRRTTHLNIDTRLVGRALLTIEETLAKEESSVVASGGGSE